MNNDKFIFKAAKALGDRNRLLILREIARQGSLTVTQAQHLTNLAQPSISHHVKLLTESELIDANKTGRTVNLSLNQEKMSWFIDFFALLGKTETLGPEPIASRVASN
ncbi:MAG: metalloregulator ArsR/SmtB family transcription factor [Bacteroidota bacterium]